MGRVWWVLWVCVALAMWGCGEREAAPGAARPVAPVAQPPAPRVLEHVTNGYTHCRLLEGGDVECWGKNLHGQVGDGTTEAREAPVVVLRDVKLLSMGWLSSCALKRDDTLWCWGDAFGGKDGFSDAVGKLSPKRFAYLPGVKQISKGLEVVYVLTESGRLRSLRYCGQVDLCANDLDLNGLSIRALRSFIGLELYALTDKGYAFISYDVEYIDLKEDVLDVSLFGFNVSCAVLAERVRCFSADTEILNVRVSQMYIPEIFIVNDRVPTDRSTLCFLSKERDVLCVRSTSVTPRRIASLERDERLFKREYWPNMPNALQLCALRDSDQRVRCFDDRQAYRVENALRDARLDLSVRSGELRCESRARMYGPEPESPAGDCTHRRWPSPRHPKPEEMK